MCPADVWKSGLRYPELSTEMASERKNGKPISV